MDEKLILLNEMSLEIRKDIIKMAYNSGIKGAHLGGSLSVVEILTALYGNVMNYNLSDPISEKRDRLILSKAHAAVGLYAALHYVGYLSDVEIDEAMRGESPYFEHPRKMPRKGIEFSGGSLGQGLSLGVGTALGLKKKELGSRVYVILGDGECEEGQIWEAALSAVKYGLDNLTVIVDANGLQYDGTTESIVNYGSLVGLWESIGFDTVVAEGHNVKELISELNSKRQGNPKAIIAKTIKGKGISFMENRVEWHTGRLTDELYDMAMKELSYVGNQ